MSEIDQRFHILYVEDDDDAYDAWGERLEQLDTRLLEGNNRHDIVLDRARDQQEAMEKVRERANRGFDLVVLDLRYPEDAHSEPDDENFRGLAWLPELSQLLPNATIAVFTAHSTERFMQGAVTALLRDGAHEFIPKTTPWAEVKVRLQVAWKFALNTRARQSLQRGTIMLLRSRAGEMYLYDAVTAVDRHGSHIKSMANQLERMGEEGHRSAAILRGRYDELNRSIKTIQSEAEGRKSKLEGVPNLSAWLFDRLYWFTFEFRSRQIALRWPADPAIALRSHLDDIRVAVHELLQNALCGVCVRGRKDGEVSVTITPLEETPGARIKVQDTGIGFAEEDLREGAALLRGYSRWPANTDPNVDHKGLGLSLARRVANNLGGALKIGNVDPSDRSKGAVVELLLPDLLDGEDAKL